MVSVFGLPPLAPNRPLPRPIFDGICDVLCTSSTPQKRAGFLPRGGSAAPARLPIAKAKATPHAMRSNMPGIRCLVHRRISQNHKTISYLISFTDSPDFIYIISFLTCWICLDRIRSNSFANPTFDGSSKHETLMVKYHPPTFER